jgi:hypothetical protein
MIPIGTKVKVTKNESGHEFEIGDVVIIEKYYPEPANPHYRCSSGEDYWFLNEKEFEIIKTN